MKRFLFILVFLGLGLQDVNGQCRIQTCGLVVRGEITELETEKKDGFVNFFAKLNVQFINKGDRPIILFANEFPDGYWLGGTSIYLDDTENNPLFSDGAWQSIIGSPKYRDLASRLDVKIPPEELTRILQPNETWMFEDEALITFDAEKNTRYPEHRTWKEMQGYQPTLYLTISYELSPWNVEYFKHDLIRKLRKRWKDHGNVLVEQKKEGRFNHFGITSERMPIDFNKARPRLVSASN